MHPLHINLALLVSVALVGVEPFIESGGLAVIEAESVSPVGSWTLETYVPGFTGTGFLEWKRGNASSGTDGGGSGVLSYPLRIATPGRYRLQLRAHTPGPTGDHNDVWVRTTTVQLMYKSNDTFTPINGWTKCFIYGTVGAWTWSSATVDHTSNPLYVDIAAAGDHVIELSGRSTQYRIDRFVLYTGAVSEAVATNPATPASPRADGGLTGDADGNGVVDGRDLDLVRAAFGRRAADGLSPGVDLNGDGRVDANDMREVVSQQP